MQIGLQKLDATLLARTHDHTVVQPCGTVHAVPTDVTGTLASRHW